MPVALQKAEASLGTVNACFGSMLALPPPSLATSTSLVNQQAAAISAAGSSSSAGTSSGTLIAQSHSALTATHSGPCPGLVSGPAYFPLAVVYTDQATAKIGKQVATDERLEYVCTAYRESRTAVVHLRTCSENSPCVLQKKSNSTLLTTIKQRADRAMATSCKLDALDSLLQTGTVATPVKELMLSSCEKKDKSKCAQAQSETSAVTKAKLPSETSEHPLAPIIGYLICWRSRGISKLSISSKLPTAKSLKSAKAHSLSSTSRGLHSCSAAMLCSRSRHKWTS
jgi:hypothetical protein